MSVTFFWKSRDHEHGAGLEQEIADRENQALITEYDPGSLPLGAERIGSAGPGDGLDAELHHAVQGYGIGVHLGNRNVRGTPGGKRGGEKGNGHGAGRGRKWPMLSGRPGHFNNELVVSRPAGRQNPRRTFTGTLPSATILRIEGKTPAYCQAL